VSNANAAAAKQRRLAAGRLTDLDIVLVSDEQGNCASCRADPYERYLPWEYAQFVFFGVKRVPQFAR